MSTNLSPENEAILAEAVSSGVFASPHQALDEALRLLRRKVELEEALLIGLNSGEPIEVDAAFWDAKRAELQRRFGSGQS